MITIGSKPTKVNLDCMTKAQLLDYASERGIVIQSAKKAEIIKEIEAALEG